MPKIKLSRINVNDKRLSMESREQLFRAQRIIKNTVTCIKAQYSYLSFVLSDIEWIPVKEHIMLATDGLNIYYNAVYVNLMIKKGIEPLKKEIIHIVLHGMSGHYEKRNDFSDKKLAWILMDYCVDRLYKELSGQPSNDLNMEAERLIREKGGDNTEIEFPYGTYLWGTNDSKNASFIRRSLKHYEKDDHIYWYMNDRNDKKNNKNNKNNKKKDNNGVKNEQSNEELKAFWENARIVALGQIDTGNGGVFNMLHRISRMYNVSTGAGSGDEKSCFMPAERACLDYSELLMELISISESKYEDPDSIDPMMYNYGIELYDDMPLIEPTEENEKIFFNNIVIAIDTSGSCSGQIASQFLKETEAILDKIEELGDFKRVTLLECDAKICGQHNINSSHEISRFTGKNFELTGFGGTSFIPVFDWVKEEQDKGEKIDALIYLSDGYGDFPETKQNVKTYFVTPGSDHDMIPDWITPVKLNVDVDFETGLFSTCFLSCDEVPFM